MDLNKAIFKGIKIAFVVMLVLLIVYGIMRVSFAAYDYGYRMAIESLTNTSESTESTEGTGE